MGKGGCWCPPFRGTRRAQGPAFRTNEQNPVQVEDQGPQTRAPKPEPQRQSKCNPEWPHPGPKRKVLLGTPWGHKLRVMLLVAKCREAPGPGGDKPRHCGWTSLELTGCPLASPLQRGYFLPRRMGWLFSPRRAPRRRGRNARTPVPGSRTNTQGQAACTPLGLDEVDEGLQRDGVSGS